MLLISTSSLKGYWLHKIFKIAKKSGYDWINLDLISWDFDSEDTEYIKELSDDFEVKVLSITAYERKMDIKTVDILIKMAQTLWAKVINFYPPHRADKDTTRFSSYLWQISSKISDIDFNIINVESKTFLFFIPEYKDATLTTIKKITWKTTLSIANIDPTTWIDLLKAFSTLWHSISNVFLSDKSGIKQDIFIGKWDMPLESLLIKLKEWWYKWFFTLKISPKELSVWKDEVVLKKLEEAKKYFEKYFK